MKHSSSYSLKTDATNTSQTGAQTHWADTGYQGTNIETCGYDALWNHNIKFMSLFLSIPCNGLCNNVSFCNITDV